MSNKTIHPFKIDRISKLVLEHVFRSYKNDVEFAHAKMTISCGSAWISHVMDMLREQANGNRIKNLWVNEAVLETILEMVTEFSRATDKDILDLYPPKLLTDLVTLKANLKALKVKADESLRKPSKTRGTLKTKVAFKAPSEKFADAAEDVDAVDTNARELNFN